MKKIFKTFFCKPFECLEALSHNILLLMDAAEHSLHSFSIMGSLAVTYKWNLLFHLGCLMVTLYPIGQSILEKYLRL